MKGRGRSRSRRSRAWILGVVVVLMAGAGQPASAQQPAADTGTAGSALRLTLGGAARLAARRSAKVQETAAQAEGATAGVTVARSAMLPDLSLSGLRSDRTFNTASFGISFPTIPGQPPLFNPNGEVLGPIHEWDLRGHVSETLFDWSALKRLSSAKADASAAQAQTRAVADDAAAGGAVAYLEALRADAVVKARSQDLHLAQDLLRMAERQLQAGVGVALDVTRAQAQVAEVRAQLLAARNDASQARLALRRALGVPLDTPVVLTDSLAELPLGESVPDVKDAVRSALGRRSDLHALDRRLQATSAQISALRALRLPSLSVVGDDGLYGLNPSHMLQTYSWGVQVSVPIFEGFRISGQVDQQKAQRLQVEIERRDLVQQISYEVRSAILDLQSTRQQVDAAREHLRLAQQEVDQARERFRAGVAGNGDVVTASLELDGARTQYIGALTAYQAARVSLARTTGTIRSLP